MNNELAIKAENEDFLYSNLEVKKSNYLISAKFSCSLLEVQLLTLGVQRAAHAPDGRIMANFSAKEIRSLLAKDYKDVYSQLKKTAIKLLDNTIIVEDAESKKFAALNIVSACKSENGNFMISFTKESEDIVLSLKGGFTPMNVKLLTSFSSVLSFRLYEILRSKTWEAYKIADNLYSIDMDISELRVTLGWLNIAHPDMAAMMSGKESIDFDKVIEKGFKIAEKDPSFKTPKWNDFREFRRGVLDVAIPEINEKSDIEVNYRPIKQGKGGRVVGLTFTMEKKDKKSKKPENNVIDFPRELSHDDIISEIMYMPPERIKISEAEAVAKAGEFNFDKIKEKNELSQISGYDNWTSWMIAALKGDYQKNTEISRKPKKKKSNQFDNFTSRDYDYDSLMKEALARTNNH